MQDDSFEEFDERPSKSEIKREMHALQDLAKQLVELTPHQLSQVPMPETLEIGVKDAQRFSREARRRQLQYLGKLMRKIDPEPIQAALMKFDQSSAENTARMHLLEKWRDRLIAESNALTDFLNEYPGADVQHLRQLIRQAKAEKSGANRALFRYVRDHIGD